MKIIASFFITFCLFSVSTHAETVLSCKKRNPWVYTSFYWVQIEKNSQGEFTFFYGNGVDDQMLDVYLTSPVIQTTDGNFESKSDEYSLSTVIIHSKLSFTLSNKTQSVTRKNFECESNI